MGLKVHATYDIFNLYIIISMFIICATKYFIMTEKMDFYGIRDIMNETLNEKKTFVPRHGDKESLDTITAQLNEAKMHPCVFLNNHAIGIEAAGDFMKLLNSGEEQYSDNDMVDKDLLKNVYNTLKKIYKDEGKKLKESTMFENVLKESKEVFSDGKLSLEQNGRWTNLYYYGTLIAEKMSLDEGIKTYFAAHKELKNNNHLDPSKWTEDIAAIEAGHLNESVLKENGIEVYPEDGKLKARNIGQQVVSSRTQNKLNPLGTKNVAKPLTPTQKAATSAVLNILNDKGKAGDINSEFDTNPRPDITLMANGDAVITPDGQKNRSYKIPASEIDAHIKESGLKEYASNQLVNYFMKKGVERYFNEYIICIDDDWYTPNEWIDEENLENDYGVEYIFEMVEQAVKKSLRYLKSLGFTLDDESDESYNMELMKEFLDKITETDTKLLENCKLNEDGFLKPFAGMALTMAALTAIGIQTKNFDEKCKAIADELGVKLDKNAFDQRGSAYYMPYLQSFKYDGGSKDYGMTPEGLCKYIRKTADVDNVEYKTVEGGVEIMFVDRYSVNIGNVIHRREARGSFIVPNDYFEVSFIFNESKTKRSAIKESLTFDDTIRTRIHIESEEDLEDTPFTYYLDADIGDTVYICEDADVYMREDKNGWVIFWHNKFMEHIPLSLLDRDDEEACNAKYRQAQKRYKAICNAALDGTLEKEFLPKNGKPSFDYSNASEVFKQFGE